MIRDFNECKEKLNEISNFISIQLEHKVDDYSGSEYNTTDHQKIILNELYMGRDVECACLMGWYPVNLSNHVFDFVHNCYRKIEK